MESCCIKVRPHPQFMENLFAYRKAVSSIFADVLGLYDINHIAITQVTVNNQFLAFSSTPALEYNLFQDNLWLYDLTYQPEWFKKCSTNFWEELYLPSHYNELYFLRQLKPNLPTGISLALEEHGNHLIYSFASKITTKDIKRQFLNQKDNLHKIGRYCHNLLLPYFQLTEK